MKVSKEFKDEYKQEEAEITYVLRRCITWFVSIVVILGIVFGGINIAERYVKKNADREIFKQSVTYNEGMLDDLAKYKFEYDTAEDDIAKEAIKTVVRSRFANYDRSRIENIELRRFLEECGR